LCGHKREPEGKYTENVIPVKFLVLKLLSENCQTKSKCQTKYVYCLNLWSAADVENREFKQIATAGATTAAVTEKVWGEYVSTVGQI